MGNVVAICTSEVRGIQKTTQPQGEFVVGYGIAGDAHGGNWHRQVSLLSAERVAEFNAKGADVRPGAFGENLVVAGFDFRTLPVGSLLQCGDVLLEMTQIGKECHTHCQIYHKMGECIMPHQGVFARVIQGGIISVGDTMTLVSRTAPLPFQAGVITLSDRCFAKERPDLSGGVLCDALRQEGFDVVEQLLLPDERPRLEKELMRLADQRQLDLILTTGGTGFAPRDITPEATLAVAHRQAPGIAEAIRAASMTITPRAMLSRGAAVIRGKTLIINLPGSPKACRESLAVFMDQMPHALDLLRNQPQDCGR